MPIILSGSFLSKMNKCIGVMAIKVNINSVKEILSYVFPFHQIRPKLTNFLSKNFNLEHFI